MINSKFTLALLSSSFIVSTAYATEMESIGSLKSDNSGTSSAYKISADGLVTVGRSITDSGGSQAFKYDAVNGMVGLGTLKSDNSGYSSAYNMSSNGSIIIGDSDVDSGGSQAFKYDAVNGMVGLGTLKADNSGTSSAYKISADGSIIIGKSSTDIGGQQAFKYDAVNGMVGLGTLKSDNSGSSLANAVNADGSVIVGKAGVDAGGYQAFKHDDTNGMIGLGTLKSDNTGSSSAEGVSADGLVIVGEASADSGFWRAFKHDAVNGMVDLGTLKSDDMGGSKAKGINADGSIIVGVSDTDGWDYQAFKHDAVNGMIGLGTLKSDNTGYSEPYGMSDDGSVIVGEADTDNGDIQAFIYKTEMQDLGNLNKSFAVIINDTKEMLAQKSHVLKNIVNNECTINDASKYCIGISDAFGQSIKSGTSMSNSLMLTGGKKVSSSVTMGATVALTQNISNNKTYKMNTGLGLSNYIKYEEDQYSQKGLKSKIALGVDIQKGKISRGEGLAGLQKSSGKANWNSMGVSSSVGYGMGNEDFSITPELQVSYEYIYRDSYKESDELDFSAQYEKASYKNFYVSPKVKLAKINEKSIYSLTTGANIDLSSNEYSLKGTSNMPGLEEFNMETKVENEVRPFIQLDYLRQLEMQRNLNIGTTVGLSKYEDRADFNFTIGYGFNF